VQHGIVHQRRGQAAIGVNVGEVELPARLQRAPDLIQHRRLVLAQVDHAVGDDHVDAARRDAGGGQILDPALHEPCVGGGVAEHLGVRGLMVPRHRQLLGRGVDADDLALRPHELRQHEGVAAGAAAQVEHGHALKPFRRDQTAAIIPLRHLMMDPGKRLADVEGRRGGVAARAGLEILRAGQDLTVVVLDFPQGHRSTLLGAPQRASINTSPAPARSRGGLRFPP
jgi:hypothetical protein